MHLKKSGVMVSTLAALSASTAFAATTPYDLIRPTWPLSWDAKVFENFDTTVTKKTGMLPKEATPASFKAGAMMPDTESFRTCPWHQARRRHRRRSEHP